jgi:hypothetical protein
MDRQPSGTLRQLITALPEGIDMAFAKWGDMCSMGPCAPFPMEE